MTPGDRLYPSIDARPLSIAIRGDAGWWDFTAGAYAPALGPLDVKRFTARLAADPVMPYLQSAIIPALARCDPACIVIEGVITVATTSRPASFQCTDPVYWIALAAL